MVMLNIVVLFENMTMKKKEKKNKVNNKKMCQLIEVNNKSDV